MTKIKSVPKNPGRKGARSPLPQLPPSVTAQPAQQAKRGRLYVDPSDVRDKADLLGAVSPHVGGPLSDMNYEQQSTQEEQYVMVVDPQVLTTGDKVHNDILRYPEVVQTSQVDPAKQEAKWQQVKSAGQAYAGAVARDQDVQDSLAVVGHDNRKLRARLRLLIPHALDNGLILAAERPAIRVAWQRIQAEEAKADQKAADNRKHTVQQNQQAAADQEKAQRRVDLVDTILDLKQGNPVDPARGAAAVRTQDELAAEQTAAAEAEAAAKDPATGRRGRTR